MSTHPMPRQFEDAIDHPDLTLYEGFLIYGTPVTSPAPEGPSPEPAMRDPEPSASLPEDIPDPAYPDWGPDPLIGYPEQSWTGHDPDLALIPEIGPDSDPSPEDEDGSGPLEIRAARLVAEIKAVSRSRSDALYRGVLSVLQEFPHHSSFEAIRRAILEGHTVEEIVDACALKVLWRDSPHLWMARRHDRRDGVVISSADRMRHGLTWIGALGLIEDHGLVGAENGLISDWIDDWLDMRSPGPEGDPEEKREYHYYASYVMGRSREVRMADPNEWPYRSLFDHDPEADPLVRARVIPVAFAQYETGPARERPATGDVMIGKGPVPAEGISSDESPYPDLSEEREIEDFLMSVAIRGYV
jgi:hypothetical protein